MVMWDEIAAEVPRRFPDVTWDKMLVDAMTVRMTLKPEPRHHRRDQPARRHPLRSRRRAGRLASASRRPPTSIPSARFPSMFEPIHGSAFDITGKGIANPVGTFWTASMMLEHLGEAAAAARLMRATPDVGGKATTREVTEAVIGAIQGSNV
jgi:tartrate dehydrogenase/decarboxylase/D-malate dehydrogenase